MPMIILDSIKLDLEQRRRRGGILSIIRSYVSFCTRNVVMSFYYYSPLKVFSKIFVAPPEISTFNCPLVIIIRISSHIHHIIEISTSTQRLTSGISETATLKCNNHTLFFETLKFLQNYVTRYLTPEVDLYPALFKGNVLYSQSTCGLL